VSHPTRLVVAAAVALGLLVLAAGVPAISTLASAPPSPVQPPAPPAQETPEAEPPKTPRKPSPEEAPEPRASQDVKAELAAIADGAYRPALKKASFVFRHHAFENAAYPYRSARFRASFAAPDSFELEVVDLHEAHELMAPRLVELMEWVRLVTSNLPILSVALDEERVQRVLRQGELTTVVCRMDEGKRPWQLKFRRGEGERYYLHLVESAEFGRVLLRYDEVEGVEVVRALEIDHPATALGRWTLELEELDIET